MQTVCSIQHNRCLPKKDNLMHCMKDIDLRHKKVLIRQDLNVPIYDHKIISDARLRAALPTVIQALEQGAQVILMSHLARPKEGQWQEKYSLLPVADYLSKALDREVQLVRDLDEVPSTTQSVILLENVRFNVGEKENDDALAQRYAQLCDVFVMDAFGSAHRKQASTYGVARYAPVACAGPLLESELHALSQAFQQPKRPVVALVGGSKVSTKLHVLDALADQVDTLIVGGGIANTFLAAQGYQVGKSLYEADLQDAARAIQAKTYVPLPIDVVVAQSFADEATAMEKTVDAVTDQDMILDLGTQSTAQLETILKEAGTIIWNGPVGVFEFPAFSQGTARLAQAVALSKAYSIAGGGDTLAAMDTFNVADQISYTSTGGGAFLEFLEGKTLPAVEALMS